MLDRYRAEFKPVGKITEDVKTYLGNFGYPKTAVHCIAVAGEAKSLAARFQSNPFQAELAGCLHDVSAVIPANKRLEFAFDSIRVF